MKVLVTGAAGFIGMHVAERLLERGDTVVGLDNLSDYYDVRLKRDRIDRLHGHSKFAFEKVDIADRPTLDAVFDAGGFRRIVHLAAQAGVRHSLTHPHSYAHSNLVGFLNVLEACRRHAPEHLVYASTSSVYGGNAKMPFSEADGVDHPITLYAATKKANELMAHAYSHLYGLSATGLRFFTVFGPWGRPDMAIFKFTRAILAGEPIQIYNHGDMQRDFTYIDDIVDGVVAALDRPAMPDPDFDPLNPDPSISTAAYRIFNIGHQQPVPLMEFIAALEQALGRTALKEFLPMQPGDVPATHADMSRLSRWSGGLQPRTEVREGVARFVDWYRSYYAC